MIIFNGFYNYKCYDFMENNTNNDYLNDNNIMNEDIQSLSSIYRQISTEFNDCFDEIDENKFLFKLIDDCFPLKFKQIESKKIIEDVTLFNTNLVIYIKFCKKNNYNKIDIIFIIFCDYFNLPYNIMFKKLHPKIKNIILNNYIDYVGIDEYEEQKIKYEGNKDYVQPTLFDLLKQNSNGS